MVSEQEFKKEVLIYNDHSFCVGCDVIMDGEDGLICPDSMQPIPDDKTECIHIIRIMRESEHQACITCKCLDADRCGDAFYPLCEVRTCEGYDKLEELSMKQTEGESN